MRENNVLSASANIYALDITEAKTYPFALAFIFGNIFFPQLCHSFGLGHTLLPIYFFTLIGAYKYGMSVGLLTAVLSPLFNHFLFGMPPVAALPAIFTKSVLLAVFASMLARRFGRVSLFAVALSVCAYQVVGTFAEYLFFAPSFVAAVVDFTEGISGIVLQIFGGYALLRMIRKI